MGKYFFNKQTFIDLYESSDSRFNQLLATKKQIADGFLNFLKTKYDFVNKKWLFNNANLEIKNFLESKGIELSNVYTSTFVSGGKYIMTLVFESSDLGKVYFICIEPTEDDFLFYDNKGHNLKVEGVIEVSIYSSARGIMLYSKEFLQYMDKFKKNDNNLKSQSANYNDIMNNKNLPIKPHNYSDIAGNR